MGNPFNIGPFNCCSCPEPPGFDAETDGPMAKYINMCACPSVAIVSRSVSKTAELCGFSEFTGDGFVASVPPKKYRESNVIADGKMDSSTDQVGTRYNAINVTGGEVFHVDTCNRTSLYVYQTDIVGYREGSNCSGAVSRDWFTGTAYGWVAYRGGLDCEDTPYYSNDTSTEVLSNTSFKMTYTGYDDPTDGFGRSTFTLEEEDTEADALARETPTIGTLSSSVYQQRTTSFSYTLRLSYYTATASNLVIGVLYEGCVRLRRRKAYSGDTPIDPDTGVTEVIAWEDVAPDTIAPFTPTATSEIVADDEDLPVAIGYEYQVVSAHVWPVSAGCDCPTSYVEPAP